MTATCVEYVWIGGQNELRSKTKVIQHPVIHGRPQGIVQSLSDLPKWNYDGSSTGQAQGTDSEVVIIPRAIFNDPFRNKDSEDSHKMVMCDTYTPNNVPLPSNHRVKAVEIFNKGLKEEPWFGLEQEYFLFNPNTNKPLGFPNHGSPEPQGQYYCSVGMENTFGRDIADTHLELCISAGIKISGINSEVAPGQWEFQIGPCVGIEQGDHLWMARYILNRVAEKYNVRVNYDPKPMEGDWNGSGCHTNYSTRNMRSDANVCGGIKQGIEYIHEAIEKLAQKHADHMSVYGTGNELRMTGEHETADYNVFTHGIANRGASIRIGNENYRNGKGYFEDRRPSSNCDPYLVTSKIFETTVL